MLKGEEYLVDAAERTAVSCLTHLEVATLLNLTLNIEQGSLHYVLGFIYLFIGGCHYFLSKLLP